MSSIDYTPVLLAQLTDLQMRVTNQETIISSLKAEMERLVGHTITTPTHSTMKSSIPLLPTPSSNYPTSSNVNTRTSHENNYKSSRQLSVRTAKGPDGTGVMRRSRPQVATVTKPVTGPTDKKSLSDILTTNENVTLQVITAKDSEGNNSYAKAIATFDGTELLVTECELDVSLVGMKSTKPGEILYKFIDHLKNAGHIKRTFTIAPWKLCSVERNGKFMTLEELRNSNTVKIC